MRVLGWRPALLVLVVAACSDAAGDEPPPAAGGSQAGGSDSGGGGNEPGTGGMGGSGGMDGSGGKGGSGGGAGGDDAPDGARRGAMSVEVLPSDKCFVDPGFYDFPEIAAGHPVTAKEKTALFKDAAISQNNEKMTVFCTLRPVGGAEFFLTATIRLLAGSQRTLQVGGTVSLSGGRNLGATQEEPSQFESFFRIADCSLTVQELNAESLSIWGTMTCKNGKVNGLERDEACGVEIQFAFENCDPE